MSKIHNNWRVFLAEKTFQDFSNGEKDKWIDLAYDELMADKAATAAGVGEDTINKELYDLIDVSYANIGGHVSFTGPNDMPSDYPIWQATDVDDDPQPDAVIFGRGERYSGGAADGGPEQTTALQKMEDEILAEIKDYSTGKKYFVSDFQEKARKRNIKAKKRLIGTGNKGALSGLGAMEEKKTVKDHLDEDPKYYDKLEKIEKKLEERIVKQGSKFCLKSKKSGKNLGCYPTKSGAKKREKQVQYFKHVNESATLEEGILSWLGLDRQSTPEKEKEQYTDYSQPESSLPLYIGAFPSIVRGEMEDALTRLKFKKIYNMSKDAKDLMKINSGKEYNKLVADGVLVDEYAIEDLDLDETTDAQRIQEENALLMRAAEQIKDLVKAGEKVLVVCSEGRNRSVATSIVALKALGMSPQEAYEAIKAARAKTIDEVELLRAAKENRRPKKMNKPVMQIGDKPHARFMKFVGVTPEKIEEMIERFLAKILKGG